MPSHEQKSIWRTCRPCCRASGGGTRNQPRPPGQVGGQYRPLTDNEVGQIIDEAYRVLEEIGMGEVPPQLQEKALEQGAFLKEGRLCYPRAMLEAMVAATPSTYTFYGRDPKYDITVGQAHTTAPAGRASKRSTEQLGITASLPCKISMISPVWPIRWIRSASIPASAWPPTCPIIGNWI